MFYNGRIYFASDRDGTMNIWSMLPDGKDLKQHTFSSGWDLMSPYLHESKIVYQKGADIGLYDIDKNEDRILDISIASDFDQRAPRWIKNPTDKISYWEVSPGGKLVALISRGRLFVTPANGSRWVELTRKSGVRYKIVAFLDDKTVVYLSDESGEYEIWKAPADGSGTPQQLTKNSKVLITDIYVAPNGKHIAYVDKDVRLTLYSVADGTTKVIEQNENGGVGGVTWSKDGGYLTYESVVDNLNVVVRAYQISTGKNQIITTERTNSYNGQFSFDGKWYYFVSDRNINSSVGSPWGPRQPEPYFDKVSKIYAFPLAADLSFPFEQPDGWVEEKKEEEKKTEEENSKTKKKSTTPAPEAATIIDWSTFSKKLFELPLAGKNILRMRIAEKHVYWTEMEAGQYDKQKLYALKIGYEKKQEPTLVADEILGFDLSPDKKKITIDKNGTLYITDADGSKADLDKTKLDLSNWAFQFDPVDDWKQMFNDAWRMERDYFYDRNLHGVDWVGVRKRYEPLLPRITDRHELDHLVAQMVAELSALHTFVYGGEKRTTPIEVPVGSLGARLEKDGSGKGFKIAHIYQNDPDYPEYLSPLMTPSLKIQNGDILLKIDDQPVDNHASLYRALSNKVKVNVKLTLKNSKGELFDQLVKPISEWDENDLRYSEWEYTRRLEVEEKTSSQVGYIHLKAMTRNDINDFTKQFYPVFNRGGLILDVRHNGGGNIDSWVLEKLMRKAWFFWQPPVGKPYWNMQYAFRGHIVVLCDESTGSDGEAVTEGIRSLKLGTIIGTRTWGGEIWLTSSNRLVDGGIATAAEFGVYADGKWLIEGHGVDPDIVVDNEPYTTFQGRDLQLEAAIRFLQDKMAKEPVVVPKAPPYPDKSFKYKE
jgi:tricorn protease